VPPIIVDSKIIVKALISFIITRCVSVWITF